MREGTSGADRASQGGMLLTLLLASALAQAPVRIESSVDGGPRDASWKYVRAGQRVELQVAGAPETVVDARWFELVPTTLAVDNTRPSFRFVPIAYDAVELSGCRGALRCAIPTASPGARAFQVELLLPGGEVRRSPGREAIELGGLGRKVHKIAVRRDDSYLGLLTELLGTPYIFGSSGVRGVFQPELLIGSDCADLVVYGLRRQGRAVRYTSTFGLETVAAKVATAAGPGEVRIGPGGVREGDLLHFPRTRHVGVLYEDRAPLGVLDDNDLILHTCWAKATVEPLSATGCASWPVRVLRPPPLEAGPGSSAAR